MRQRAAMWVGGLFFLFLLSACGRPTCTPNNCNGCCTIDGECLGGSSQNACGLGGASCDACDSASTCLAGTCLPNTSATGGGSGTFPRGGGSGSQPRGGGSGSNTIGDTGPSCTTESDCPYWYCECREGPPVNSRRCINNHCKDGANSCPSACSNFGTCWVGYAGGGFTGGSNVGPSTCSSATGGGSGTNTGGTCTYSDLGKGCKAATDCQSQLCFGQSPSFICTKSCTTANDCPYNWSCEPSSQGGRICLQGLVSPTGSTSTSNSCSTYSNTGVGGPCTTASCSSNLCIGNTCTKRCSTNADCPASWTCKTAGTSFSLCSP